MLDLRTGVRLLTQTLPILAVRVGAALLFGAALAVYLAIAAGLAWLLGALSGVLGVIVFIVALAGIWPLYQLASRYVFYLLKAAHVAVMVELLERGQLPSGESQVSWGKAQVQSRFRDTSALFLVHELVSGVVRAFSRTVQNLIGWLPIEGMGSVFTLFNAFLRFATGDIDQAILSRAYLRREQNVWAVAQDGVVLYAMCWKPILTQSLLLALLSVASVPLFIVGFGVPAIALAAILPGALRGALAVAVIASAVLLKLALTDSLSLATILAVYHRQTQGLVPDPVWVAKLDGVSDTFRTLQQRAAAAVAPAATAGPVAVPGPRVTAAITTGEGSR